MQNKSGNSFSWGKRSAIDFDWPPVEDILLMTGQDRPNQHWVWWQNSFQGFAVKKGTKKFPSSPF
jgi:hypothetical protein